MVCKTRPVDHNLLGAMWNTQTFMSIPLLLAPVVGNAQSEAALGKLQQRYTAAQLADLEANGHYKYVGLLLFYAASFEVEDQGQFHPPTEAEIAAIDLHAHDALRQEDADVVVLDAPLGKPVLLYSRKRSEEVLLAALNNADRAAYLAYKAGAFHDGAGKVE